MSVNITDDQNVKPVTPGAEVVSYCVHLVAQNRDSRDLKYKGKWDQYERVYRGIYSSSDQSREGERSRLIAPALMQAIDSIHATITDAIFGRQQWIDIEDEFADESKEDVQQARKALIEDLELTNTQDALSKIILMGCIYGTGIGKINVKKKRVPQVTSQTLGGPVVKWEERPVVALEPVPPWEFVLDSQARDHENGLFCACETHVPKNVVWTKQIKGIYRKDATILGFNTSKKPYPAGESSVDENRKFGETDGAVWVTEYYGLVPAKLVRKAGVEVPADRVQGNGMVECIVTIANETELLRIVLNPFTMEDRPIVAYQHNYLPGKWWGAGVAEKGWNAQRALDAELRARMDALGLLTSPMMGADITRLPRNPDMRVRPGKVWLTRGRPSEVLEPIILGNIDPQTFNQSSEMERLVQVGTGSIESNAPLNTDRRNETASGISMIQSSALKRQKATMSNIERQLLNPFIRKTLWRLMQFNPQRYPADYDFCVKGTMGIVAREFEQGQLTSLLSVIPPESPAHGILLKGIVELSGSPQRDELIAAIEKAMQPDPEQQKQQQMMQQIQLESAKEALKEQQSENQKTLAEIQKIMAEIEQIKKLTDLEDEKVDIQAANVAAQHAKARADMKARDEDRKVKQQEIRAKAKVERTKAKQKGDSK
jgi:hypothetical protein